MNCFARLLVLLWLCWPAWAADTGRGALSEINAQARARLLEGLQCPAPVWQQLIRMKSGNDIHGLPPADATMCGLALDAFCTSSPERDACRHRRPTGAYAGYYLMRYVMPVVVLLREMQRSAIPADVDGELMATGFDSVFGILSLMSPNLRGCRNLPGVRTWCTVSGDSYQAVASHRAATAYLASEGLRLLAECRQRDPDCPISRDRLDPVLVRWFDVLLWDHALLDGTALRNSLTQHVRTQPPAALRLRYLRDSFDPSANDTPAFQFATDGWWIAVAANLLAVDGLLNGDDDPRPVALTVHQHAALRALVSLGVEVLGQRREDTRVRDFEGKEARGLQFDSKLWDRHEYRRFSGIDDGPRPFSIVFDISDSAPKVVYAGPEESRAQNVGLDSGHYRRLTWLHYTLSDVEDSIDAEWIDDDLLEGLANQFAYAVHWHPCREQINDGCSSANASPGPEATPRFVNYASGQSGWYRLTPAQPCDAAVPPFGFSTLMVISENLWWAKFNADVAKIWGRLESAVNDPDLPPPSAGDTAPCGEGMGRAQWNKTYHQMVFATDGRLTNHGLGFHAMKYWATLALP